jgi:hypothetical protein
VGRSQTADAGKEETKSTCHTLYLDVRTHARCCTQWLASCHDAARVKGLAVLTTHGHCRARTRLVPKVSSS